MVIGGDVWFSGHEPDPAATGGSATWAELEGSGFGVPTGAANINARIQSTGRRSGDYTGARRGHVFLSKDADSLGQWELSGK